MEGGSSKSQINRSQGEEERKRRFTAPGSQDVVVDYDGGVTVSLEREKEGCWRAYAGGVKVLRRERDELCCFEAACVIQDKGIQRQRQRREKGEEKRANTEQMALSPQWRNFV